MKYIDRFKTLDDFLNSELQQLTGDRIATIEGFELPILKKKLKTVLSVDPSTNEEVEVEELQDVWSVPAGQVEKKVDHNFSFGYQTASEHIFKNSITSVKNYYNYDIDADAIKVTLRGLNSGSIVLYDEDIKQWGWTISVDNSKFSTTASQNGYSIVPGGNIRSYLSSWDEGGYYVLERTYTTTTEYDQGSIKIAKELSDKKDLQNLTQDSFEIHDSTATIVSGSREIPLTINKINNYYYSQYPQGFDINNIGFDCDITVNNEDILNSYNYNPTTRTLTLYISNLNGNYGASIGIWPNGIGNYSLNYSRTGAWYSSFSSEQDNEHPITLSGNNLNITDSTSLQDMTLEYDIESWNSVWWTPSGDNITLNDGDNTFVMVPKSAFTNIHLKIVVGNGGLTSLNIPANTTSIDSMVLSSAYPNNNDRPTEFAIPEGVTRIEDDAFWGWHIDAISFPSTLQYVGSRAFALYSSANGITSVTLPAGCQYFDNSFGGASNSSFVNMSTDPMDPMNFIWTPITVTGGTVYSCRLSDVLSSAQKETMKNSGIYSGMWSQIDMDWNNSLQTKITIADFDNIFDPASNDPMMNPYLYINGDYFMNYWYKLKEVNFPTYTQGQLGSNMFSGCSSLTTITGIDNITQIGQDCFKDTAISSFTLPASVTTIKSGAFKWEQNSTAPLTSFTIPNGSMLTKIEGNAFAGQANLSAITLPASCQYAATSFHSNTVITGGVQAWDMHDMNHYGQIVEDGTVTIDAQKFWNNNSDFMYGVNYFFPSSVTTIGDLAFNNCQNLSSLTLHSGITDIGTNTFANMSSLGEITLPSTLSYLGDGAFWNSSMADITFPASWSVTSIPMNCFSGTQFGSNVNYNANIPSGTTSIGDNAFFNTQLKTVTIPSTVTSIGSGAFANTSITAVTLPNGCTWYETSFPADCVVTSDTVPTPVVADLSTYGASGTLSSDWFNMNMGYNSIYSKVIIPEGVTELSTYGDTWFGYNTKKMIKEIQMPTTLTTVGVGAFKDMPGLQTIDCSALTSIPQDLFYNDSKLFEHTAPTFNSSVTLINSNAFYGTMQDVSVLDLSSTNITQINSHAFDNTGLTSVTLANGCVYNLNSFPADCSVNGGTLFSYTPTDVYNDYNIEIFPSGTTVVSSDPLMMAYDAKQKLTELTVPQTITSINGFNWYENLNSLTFEHNATNQANISIGDYSFQGDDIRSLTIPYGCGNIGESAFRDNINLSTLTFEDDGSGNHQLMTIGKAAFENTKLTSVTFPANTNATYWPSTFPAGCTVTGGSIGNYPFYVNSMNSSMSYNYQSNWTYIEIQSDVNSLVNDMFRESHELIEVVFNNSGYLYLPYNMFKDCDKLRTVTFSGSYVQIDHNVFAGTAITSVTLPAGSTYETDSFPAGCTITLSNPDPSLTPSGDDPSSGDSSVGNPVPTMSDDGAFYFAYDNINTGTMGSPVTFYVGNNEIVDYDDITLSSYTLSNLSDQEISGADVYLENSLETDPETEELYPTGYQIVMISDWAPVGTYTGTIEMTFYSDTYGSFTETRSFEFEITAEEIEEPEDPEEPEEDPEE